MGGYCDGCGNTLCICGEFEAWNDLNNKFQKIQEQLMIAKYCLLNIATVYDRPTDMKVQARKALRQIEGASNE